MPIQFSTMQDNIIMFQDKYYKLIPDYEDSYAISKDGEVLSIRTKLQVGNSFYIRQPKIIKSHPCNNIGTRAVGLCVDGKQKQYQLHRLIALAWIPNPNNYPYVLSYSDTYDHPTFDDLYWSPVPNMNAFARENGIDLKEVDNLEDIELKAKWLYKPVEKLDDWGEPIERYESLIAAAKSFEGSVCTNAQAIYRALDGKALQAKGYFWRRCD